MTLVRRILDATVLRVPTGRRYYSVLRNKNHSREVRVIIRYRDNVIDYVINIRGERDPNDRF